MVEMFLLVPVGMLMAPIPILALLFLTCPGIFVGFSMIIGQEYSPGTVFVVIPVVIVLVATVVNSNLDSAILWNWSSHNCHWPYKGCSQNERPDKATCVSHVLFLQTCSVVYLMRTARSEGKLDSALSKVFVPCLAICGSIVEANRERVCAVLHAFGEF